jgi:hypothetical protein
LDVPGDVYFPGGVILPIYDHPIDVPSDLYLPPMIVIPAPVTLPAGGIWLPGGGILSDTTTIPPGWFLEPELPAGITLPGGAIFPEGGADHIKIIIKIEIEIESARTKLNGHYQRVFADNSQYKNT